MAFFISVFSLKRLFSVRRPRPRPAIRLRLEGLEERCTPVVTDLSTMATFTTIQAAVNAANPGDILRADAGTYAENVTINKPLTLQGANHGVSGTSASRTAESIVDGTTNNGETPFDVTANGVTIDGFTIQGATNANDLGFGVVLGAGTSGSTIENNIIQNNIAGLSLANNPNGNPTVVRDNLFQNNNQAGPISGTAIYTDQFNAGGALANVVIDSNTFLNNQDTAVNFASSSPASQTNITITNNVMTNDGNAVFLADTNGAVISGNTISGSIGSQVVLAGGDANVQITQNFIQNGATNGILILEDAADGYTTTNSSDTINDNSISGNATSGLTIDSGAGAYTGTLDAANNWWGSPSGPTTPANPAGTGDKIIDPNNQVNFSPFLTSGTDSQPNTPGFQPAANAANALVVNGSAGNVTVVVTATGPDSGSYTINGGTPIPFSDIASFTFIGGTNDVLVIDNPPGALFAPPGGVFYDGSGSGDSLQIEGGDAMTETFTFSPNEANGQHDGAIALTEGTVTADYTYTNLSPVLVNAGTPNDVVFNLPNNGQDNQAVIQPSGTAGMSEIVSQDGGFETTTFANPINSLTINAAGPAGQTITVGALPGGAVTLVNGAGVGVLDFNAGDQAVGTITGTLTVAGRVALQYGGVVQINLDNAAAVGAVAGPNTTDRDTAFTGLTAQERFVQALYLDELGRAGTKAELDVWVALFNGAGVTQQQAQATIAFDIEHSMEARDNLVRSWYVAFLGRDAVGGEEQSWVAALQGQTEEQVLSQFLATPEFYNHAQTLFATGTADQRYVEALYQVLLNRPAGANEVAPYVNALPQLGRQGVAFDFLTSLEFRTDQFEGYYDALLHRPSDSTGLSGWASSGLDLAAVRVDFESSVEFFING